MRFRLAAAALVTGLAAAPLASPASAFVCAPTFRPYCELVCQSTTASRKVCSLFA